MNRREFVQAYLLKWCDQKPLAGAESWDAFKVGADKIITAANTAYNCIESDEMIAADNSMPDTRSYLDTVTGANGHG